MIVVLLIGVVYLFLGVFILFEMKSSEYIEEKHEFIETAYLWGMVVYYIFLLCLFFGD